MKGERWPICLGTAVGMVVLGVLGMVLLVWRTYPVWWARWLFLASWIWAVAGLALLGLMFFYALRHVEAVTCPLGVLMRQALEIGIYAAFLLWLRWARMLSWGLAFMGAVLHLALEGVFQSFTAKTTWPSAERGPSGE